MRKLQKLMLKTFSNEIGFLSADLQNMLADDMVTAFKNRLTAIKRRIPQ